MPSAKAARAAPEMKCALPTEAQWEYACRAGTTTAFSSGDDQGVLGEYAWFHGNSGGKTHPVGQRKPNAWGLCDMHGNVWEWCSDWWGANYYAQSPPTDPPGPMAGSDRVFRGGYWPGHPRYCRSALRHAGAPGGWASDLGFRLACEIPTEPGELAKFAAAIRASKSEPLPSRATGLPDKRPPPDEMVTLPNGWVIGEPVNLGPIVNSSEGEWNPALSADGLTLLFASDRQGSQGHCDLWMCSRASLNQPFGQPVNLGSTVNSSASDSAPALSADGVTLLFCSNRRGGHGWLDLWMCKRASPNDLFGEPLNLGPTVNSSATESGMALSADALTLLFSSDRPGGQGDFDLWMCRRASPNEPFDERVNLGPTVNSSAMDGRPALSADGLTLFVDSNRPGGQGDQDLWMCTRPSVSEPFGEPVNLGPTVNSSATEGGMALSADGLTLFFESNRPGGQGGVDLWMARIEPRQRRRR